MQLPKFDVELLLTPISIDSPVGAQVGHEVYEHVNTSVLASDWGKVRSKCAALLKEETKDVVVAAALMQSLAKLHGVAGIHDGLLLIEGLHDRFWPNLFPRRVDDDPPASQVYLNKLDRILEQVIQSRHSFND